MEFDVTPVFPTLIGRFRVPDAASMNQDLHALILAEEVKYASLGRSNIGGWHSRPDFLTRRDPAVSALTAWLTWALRRMINATGGENEFNGILSASAWATICRAGAYHAPHSHPDSAWSGVYYVDPGTDSPLQPLSGVLEFLDPRAGVDAVTAPGDPYGEPFRVRAQAGLIVVFPSWLYHWVHPYAGRTPRIAISFNATAAPVADVNAPTPKLQANGVRATMATNEPSATACLYPTSIQPARRNHDVDPIIPTCTSKLRRISSNVIAVRCDSCQETAPRGHAEPCTDGNRADPSRESSYPA